MTFFSSRFVLVIAIFFSTAAVCSAQWRSESFAFNSSHISRSVPVMPGGENVFSPDQSSVFLSAFLGLNHNTNMGTFRTDCDCEFNPDRRSFNLSNIGAEVGLDVTYQFHPNWAIVAKAYYDNKHTKESYNRDPLDTPISVGQRVIIQPVVYEEIGTVSLSYATFGLFGRWQPRLERWYVFLGPTVGLAVATSVEHNQSIVSPELSYRELGTVDSKRNVSTADFTGALRLEGMVGFGYDYIISPRWYINPELRFGYPLSFITDNISDRGKDIPNSDWKVMSAQISIGLKYQAY